MCWIDPTREGYFCTETMICEFVQQFSKNTRIGTKRRQMGENDATDEQGEKKLNAITNPVDFMCIML